ncbi:MAG: SpoIIE family protein phosphatase [Planctomycetota bacterium]|nr:SpoIIE family protein phosphatase [Planctomycetota bacterium]
MKRPVLPGTRPQAGPPAAKPPERPGTRKLGPGPAPAAPASVRSSGIQSPPKIGTRRFVKGAPAQEAAAGPAHPPQKPGSGSVKAITGTHKPVSDRAVTRRLGEKPPAAAEGEEKGKAGERPESAGPPPTVGTTLGMKFALMTALTVVIASLILALLVYKSTADELDHEINDSGKKTVFTLCVIPMDLWKEIGPKTQCVAIEKVMAAVMAECRDALVKANEAAKGPENAAIRESLTELGKKLGKIEAFPQGKLREAFNMVLGAEDPFLKGIDHKGIKAMDILEPSADGSSMMKIVGTTTTDYSLPPGVVVEEDKTKGLTIRETDYKGERVRRFQKTIGAGPGFVQLDMSLAEIDEARGRLLVPILLAGIMVIIIGALIGLVLARSVTRPVKTLLSDIDIVSGGNLDHQTIPHSTDEIGQLARTFNRMTKTLKIAHQSALETKALEHELNIATEIQQNLLPKRLPKIAGYDIFATYKPSKEVGGDYFDFIQIDEDNLGIIVADVSGKGIPGSMVMTMARSLIRMEAERNLSTSDTLIKVNRILARDIRRGMFVTCIYMILNARNKTLLVSSAGHNPMVLWRQATNKHELINPSGIALGFDKGPLFERNIKQLLVELNDGDRFLAYTDGVVESMSPESEEFGEDKFYEMITQFARKESSDLINTIVEAVELHQGKAPQHDDITIVTVRLMPPA